ncbi:hypothetical protein BDP81DRAFT_285139, partial [Colletotrichum phormii]
NNEFQVARFLPNNVGKFLYLYLVYIRPFTSMLRRVCFGTTDDKETSILFASRCRPTAPWSTGRLSKELARATAGLLGLPINTRTYRQLSIAITERHLKHMST